MRRATAAIALAGLLLAAAAAVAANKHLGAATCASSACHGKAVADPKRNVALNEYRTWLNDDSHSRAYKVLQSAASQAIAAKLGLPNAQGAKICIDCHTDNVPTAERDQFQLSDGVSCESCHGGAEKWIESHAATGATHKDNLAKGMYPSEQPQQRADLCLSCHLGTKDAFATHQIMAAGHPRLRFEMETFTTNQPAHYTKDADYKSRKGDIPGTTLWVTGQFEAARQYLTLLQAPLYRSTGFLPELAFYDCHSCHTPMANKSWTAGRVGTGLAPGGLRLNRGNLTTLQVIAQNVGSDADAQDLAGRVTGLMQAGQKDPAQVSAAAGRVLEWLKQRQAWTTRSYVASDASKLRGALLKLAAGDGASDYTIAEQVVLGAESLSYTLGDHDRNAKALDGLYDALADEGSFNPARFAERARTAQAAIK